MQGTTGRKRKIYREERIGIGAASAIGIPCGTAAEEFDIGRAHYYGSGKKADGAPENLTASEETRERVVAANKAFRERFVPAPTSCGNASASNIIAVYRQIFRAPPSKGTVCNVVLDENRKAEEAERSASPENMKDIAADEVFQNGEPVLTGADLDSDCAFPAESAPERSEETWKATLEEQKARGFNPKPNVGDGESGPVKGNVINFRQKMRHTVAG